MLLETALNNTLNFVNQLNNKIHGNWFSMNINDELTVPGILLKNQQVLFYPDL